MENNESRIPPSGQKQRLFKEHDLLPTRGICNVCQAEFQISIDQWLIAVCLSLFSFQTLILFFFLGGYSTILWWMCEPEECHHLKWRLLQNDGFTVWCHDWIRYLGCLSWGVFLCAEGRGINVCDLEGRAC